MQSSYKAILKGDSINNCGTQKIHTEFKIRETFSKTSNEKNTKDDSILKSYENLGRTILQDASIKKEKILSMAYERASEISKKAYDEAYEKGYAKGQEEGYNTAYEEGYKKNFDKAKAEGDQIKQNANDVLNKAVEEKKKYLEEKEEEIKEFILNSVESILKREVRDADSLNAQVFDALNQMKKTSTFIIKGKEKYCSEFKKQVTLWKEQLPFKGDIFIIPDESLEEGSVVIERDNGKMVLGIDIAYDKIKKILQDES
ncbi:flagellar assembly protein FliH [Clostridium autoethanogenum]|uniref:Flagellar assembly protein FliH n=1 Tax=Clostridium autoethanogenum TaxID=84023 RepID=A0A3M0T103_9CLOT|nr:flagellar assembly protein FliH [Clostridium autoethanogenum]RMD04297.1 flagellar assembly protein FliH [Clostridium autoethanogenum]